MTRQFAILAFATALLALPLAPIASTIDGRTLEVATSKQSTKWVRLPNAPTPDNGGMHRYIVQFDEAPLPLYEGGINGLAAANADASGRLDSRSSAARAYVSHLESRQKEMLTEMSNKAGTVQVLRTHQHALNAATVRMTEAQANKVRLMPGVRAVELDRAVELTTATTPGFIGADQVWDGSATGIPYSGEGMVVGIIDSGINHGHPSFAAMGGDGYVHTNPLGSGTYLGDCLAFPGTCNDKLIGSYTFLDAQTSPEPDEILLPGQIPSADTDGHGTHVASTAAGNVVLDVPLLDADGNPSSISFPQISGVAPHANIIAYKVCAPSCFFSDIVAAVDQAIADGIVDTLNHSIGSSPGNPWNSSQAQAFLAARAAGIFVANSAGNSGPDAGSAEAAGNAPWVAGVAATTHDRSYPEKMLQDMTGGETTPPANITGRSVSGGITGDIVYAGDFASPDPDGETDPAQCLASFPPGTFTASQIVMCDRGAIARTAKGQHVRDGGAGGFILGNVDGGATSVNDDTHVIPAIHINAADADAVRSWLASGTGQTGTITAVNTTISDPAAGDNLADFSSRGPYTGFDILAPNTAAPGVDILAAGAELTPGQIDEIHLLYPPQNWESVPGEFGAISGTSMSSPHIAGTAALLKQANPGWSDAEVLSAIMTTGTYDLVKEDGVTPADIFDFGGGRVQVELAVIAGLLLDESSTNFQAANPDDGGDPSSLNVAGLVKGECVGICTWTRTVTATVAGSWTASGYDSWVSVSPASFSLAAGESQEIEVTAESTGLPGGSWSFSRAVLTPSDTDVPTSQLPIAVVAESGDLPSSIDLAASRDAGSQLYTDITALDLSGFNVKIFEPAKVEGQIYALAQDSDNSDAFDDLTDGVQVVLHDVPADTQRAVFEVLRSESPDLDLFVGVVLDPADPTSGPLVCVSATGTALESCDLDPDFLDLMRSIFGPDLTYYAVIQNWAASAPDAVDAFEFATTNVSGVESTVLYAEGPSGALPALVPFNVRFFWDLPSEPGDRYLSATEWYADAARAELLGKVPLQFNRGINDVATSSDPAESAVPGEPITFTTEIQPNFTNEDRTYMVSITLPKEVQVDPASITEGGVLDYDNNGKIKKDSTITWTVTQESLLGKEGSYTVSSNVEDASCDTPFGGYVDLAGFGIGPDPSLVGDSFAGTFFGSLSPVEFFGNSRDGGLTVTDDGFGFFESTSGPAPWVNLPIPDPTEPNDMLAPFWYDWVINDDGISGISAASAAGGTLKIVEWDSVEYWPGEGSYPISGDFELFIWDTVGPGPEISFAYANLDEEWNDILYGAFGPATVGVENATGTAGTAYTGTPANGLVVCYDYEGVDSSPRQLSFTAIIEDSKMIVLRETNSVDNPGSESLTSKLKIKVKSE